VGFAADILSSGAIDGETGFCPVAKVAAKEVTVQLSRQKSISHGEIEGCLVKIPSLNFVEFLFSLHRAYLQAHALSYPHYTVIVFQTSPTSLVISAFTTKLPQKGVT